MVSRIFLVGFMGCGKSTIGKYIAADLKWQFIDMDAFFEEKHKCTISNYFALFGEDGFRKAENEVVAELSTVQNAVIATGGGAPCFFNNMDIMHNSGLVIYISVEPADLANRLRNAKDSRPLIAQKTDEELLSYITEKLSEREPSYRKAHIIVDGEHLPFSAYKTLINMYNETEK